MNYKLSRINTLVAPGAGRGRGVRNVRWGGGAMCITISHIRHHAARWGVSAVHRKVLTACSSALPSPSWLGLGLILGLGLGLGLG